MEHESFVTKYRFQKDETKHTRTLESVRVGGVYITRIIIRPKATIGNLYMTETNLVFFAQVGKLQAKFVHPETAQEKSYHLDPESGIIHVPPGVAFAIKNVDTAESVVVAFSDHPLHDHSDDVTFDVLS